MRSNFKMSDSEDSSSDGDYYGPALPPNFKAANSPAIETTRSSVIGPCLPPEMIKLTTNPEPDVATEVSAGPSSDVKHPTNRSNQIGPVLPPSLRAQLQESTEEFRGNDIEENSSSDSDDDIIGPLPPDHPKAIAANLERGNSSSSQDKPKKKLQREEWMLIPPSNKPVTELGLGPRKFLQRHPEEPVKEGEEIDSDEEFERQTRAAMDQQIIDQYDQQMEAMKDKVAGGKRKTDSLLELHQQELKKKKEEVAEKKERRPFDRDVDLSVTGLSGEDKKKFIERSRELNTRFKQGRQKFL